MVFWTFSLFETRKTILLTEICNFDVMQLQQFKIINFTLYLQFANCHIHAFIIIQHIKNLISLRTSTIPFSQTTRNESLLDIPLKMQVEVSICPIKKTCVSFVSFKQHLSVSGLEEVSNKIYQLIAHLQYINITWLTGFLVIFFIFGLVSFVLKTLLGIARQWTHEKFVIFFLKPQSHDRTLVYQIWVVHYLYLSLPTKQTCTLESNSHKC